MKGTPAPIEVHHALWAVLSIPFGFAGIFFVFPGLIFGYGLACLAIAGFLLFYVSRSTRRERIAWLIGILFHAASLAAAFYFLPRWKPWLAWPLAAFSLYSLLVLVGYRRYWIGEAVAQAA